MGSEGVDGVGVFKFGETYEDGRLSACPDEKGLFVYRPPLLSIRFTQFIESQCLS